MYFKLFKRRYRDKRAAKDRSRNCAVLPRIAAGPPAKRNNPGVPWATL